MSCQFAKERIAKRFEIERVVWIDTIHSAACRRR
jgi:hypothetical protein